MPSNVAPILFDTIQCNTPEGVSITVKEVIPFIYKTFLLQFFFTIL